MAATKTGPLRGVRVIEFAGLGPVPMAGMLLADFGADVVRVERPGAARLTAADITERGKRTVVLDLKSRSGTAAMALLSRADVCLEGFRPGVVERLGVGPAEAIERNSRLVYVRVTGWGQDGPLAGAAGHDITYISLTGVLNAIGQPGVPPQVPLNLVGDFGGGSLYAVVGVLGALLEARNSGRGQVVDVSMVDGAVSLSSLIWGLRAAGLWTDERGGNELDGGAPYYSAYETADARWLSVGAQEDRFFAQFADRAGLAPDWVSRRHDPRTWPDLRAEIAARIRTRTRAEWEATFSGSDSCVAPVLSWHEVADHAHTKARGNVTEQFGVLQPAPAPRFSRTPGRIGAVGATAEVSTVLGEWT